MGFKAPPDFLWWSLRPYVFFCVWDIAFLVLTYSHGNYNKKKTCNPTFTRGNGSWQVILCKRKLWNLLVQKNPGIYLHSLSGYLTGVVYISQVELHQEKDAFWSPRNSWKSLKTDTTTPGYTAFSRWLFTWTILYQKSRWDTLESAWPKKWQPVVARAATERHGLSAGFFHFMAGLKGPILTSDGGIRRESANGSSLRFTPPSSSCFLMRLSGLC